MTTVPRRPHAIERWLRAAEATAAADAGRAVTPGTEKLVVWNGGAPCRTDLALVYVHGYTGSRQAAAICMTAGRVCQAAHTEVSPQLP